MVSFYSVKKVVKVYMPSRKERGHQKDRAMLNTVRSEKRVRSLVSARKAAPAKASSVLSKKIITAKRGKASTRGKDKDLFKISATVALRYDINKLGKPQVWSKVGNEGKVAFYHDALVSEPYCAFTVKISDATKAKAYSCANFTTFIRESIRTALRNEFPGMATPAYWFVIEGEHSSAGWCKEHIHGAVRLPHTPRAYDRIRVALKLACGRDYPARGKQCYLKHSDKIENGTDFYWGGKYATKQIGGLKGNITGKGFARTQNLSAPAAKLYEKWRTSLLRVMADS